MARYHVNATWHDGYVNVEIQAIRPLAPEHAARLIERGMLRPDDDPVSRQQIGQFDIDEPAQMTAKRVRIAGRAWLVEHAEGAPTEIEWQYAVRADLEALARLEAALTGG